MSGLRKDEEGSAAPRHGFKVFAEFEIKDYIENPPLIEALKANASEARDNAGRSARAERKARQELEKVQAALHEKALEYERVRGAMQEKVARLEQKNLEQSTQLSDLRRLSGVAVFISWVGSVLVAAGVNLVTGDKFNEIGIAVILAGAGVEISAFFVRRSTSA
jgi:hypothetical protein